MCTEAEIINVRKETITVTAVSFSTIILYYFMDSHTVRNQFLEWKENLKPRDQVKIKLRGMVFFFIA